MNKEFQHLLIPVPDGWRPETTLSIAGAETLRLFPEAPPGCVVIFLPEVALPSVDPEEVLTEFVAGHTRGRVILAESPVDLGITEGGLYFATRQVVSRGDDDEWYCMYWALGTGEHVQCMVASGSSATGYRVLLEKLSEVLDGISPLVVES